jgi:hypothetical protein
MYVDVDMGDVGLIMIPGPDRRENGWEDRDVHLDLKRVIRAHLYFIDLLISHRYHHTNMT